MLGIGQVEIYHSIGCTSAVTPQDIRPAGGAHASPARRSTTLMGITRRWHSDSQAIPLPLTTVSKTETTRRRSYAIGKAFSVAEYASVQSRSLQSPPAQAQSQSVMFNRVLLGIWWNKLKMKWNLSGQPYDWYHRLLTVANWSLSFCAGVRSNYISYINGSFHVKSPKKVPFWPRPLSISAKIGEPIAPHDRNMYAQFKPWVTSRVRFRSHHR